MEHSVCFIGHRHIDDTSELREKLKETLCELLESGADEFIFGDHSAFTFAPFSGIVIGGEIIQLSASKSFSLII